MITPLRVRSDVDKLSVRPVTIPAWASAIGRDPFGLWAEFTIDVAAPRRWFESIDPTKVRQRLRWIPPGRFLMGSPEGEAGRFAAEGPHHEVTIEAGGRTMRRQVTAGRGFLSQSELPVTVGLGTATKVDRVTVRWPCRDKHVETWSNLQPGKTHILAQGTASP